MSGASLVIAAVVAGLLVGTLLLMGAPGLLGLPIVAVVIVVLGVLELRRRRGEAQSMQGFRDEAKADPVEFTDRDKQTLAD